jgi:hypothetical protein
MAVVAGPGPGRGLRRNIYTERMSISSCLECFTIIQSEKLLIAAVLCICIFCACLSIWFCCREKKDTGSRIGFKYLVRYLRLQLLRCNKKCAKAVAELIVIQKKEQQEAAELTMKGAKKGKLKIYMRKICFSRMICVSGCGNCRELNAQVTNLKRWKYNQMRLLMR